MCQLSFANSHEMLLNRLLIYYLALGGATSNKHGCGIMYNGTTWKSEKSVDSVDNLESIIAETIFDLPVAFHVRRATLNIAVNLNNSHPFVGKHYILMHNGTLIDNNAAKKDDKKEKAEDSDSLRFLLSLDNMKDKNPDKPFIDIINETMKKFAGKFAFIIWSKDEERYYIIRGKTADLYITYIKAGDDVVGYAINTDKYNLKTSASRALNIYELITGVCLEYTEPELIVQETAFYADDFDIYSIGAIKENDVPKQNFVTYYHPIKGAVQKVGQKFNDAKLSSSVATIKKWLDSHCLDILDLQRIFLLPELGGKSLLSLEEKDITNFIKKVIPKLSASNKLRGLVSNTLAKKGYAAFPDTLYNEFNLEYPWVLNKESEIKKALDSLKGK